jgi:osmotically-inducible protein OsmY
MLNKTNRMLAGIGAAVLIITLTGCDTTSSSHKDERSEGRTIDDKKITADVKKSLINEPAYKFDDVGVKTFAGVVQLTGFVNTDGQKMRAQDLAEHTDGVKQVVNGITLKPLMPMPTSQKEIHSI